MSKTDRWVVWIAGIIVFVPTYLIILWCAAQYPEYKWEIIVGFVFCLLGNSIVQVERGASK